MIKLRQFFLIIYRAIEDTILHDGVEHAGYLAFIAMLSLFPFLVFFVAIVGSFGQSELGIELLNLFESAEIIPENVKLAIQPRIDEILNGPPQGLLTIAILGIIWVASSTIEGLRTILNRAYRVSTPPAYILRRLLSIAQFFIITAASIIAVFIIFFIPIILEKSAPYLPIDLKDIDPMWDYLRYIVGTMILLLVVCSLYYFIPNIKQKFIKVLPGAIAVVATWFTSGYFFSLYLKEFEQVNLVYGSLGGIIATLLFFYITAMLFIFGAEFNYRIEKSQGKKFEEKQSKDDIVI